MELSLIGNNENLTIMGIRKKTATRHARETIIKNIFALRAW